MTRTDKILLYLIYLEGIKRKGRKLRSPCSGDPGDDVCGACERKWKSILKLLQSKGILQYSFICHCSREARALLKKEEINFAKKDLDILFCL